MIMVYARVSKDEQNLDRQTDLLKEYGVEKIIQEKYTGMRKERPGLEELMRTIRCNGTVVVIGVILTHVFPNPTKQIVVLTIYGK